MADDVLKRIFEAPAKSLESAVDAAASIKEAMVTKQPFRVAEEYLHTLGPGLTTGAADDDPSGIATYSQTGATFGLQLVWMSLFTFPLMAIVQEMCARIGIVTGKGLASNIRLHYPSAILYVCTGLLFAANTFNLGADLGAMAKATQLAFPSLKFEYVVAFFAIASLLLQIYTTYARYAKYLKYLTLALLSYVVTALTMHIDWENVLMHTAIPSFSFSRDQVFLICALLGTTISPYLFFWQSSQEVEERVLKNGSERPSAAVTRKVLRRMRTDVWSGMFFSNVIMFFIIVVCAEALFKNGITHIVSADQAAAALRPVMGAWAEYLFAIGIVGTGLLAVPILAGSASYALSESFRWHMGLYRKLSDAYAFYGVIIVSMLLGLIMNLLSLDPIKMLIYSAIGNGLIAPFILFLIVRISSRKDIMGTYVNHRAVTILGWCTVACMALSAVTAVFSLLGI